MMVHGIERFSRPDSNHLFVQVTIEDSVVLSKPWTSALCGEAGRFQIGDRDEK